MVTGRVVLFEEMNKRVSPAGLEFRGFEFYRRATGEKLDRGEAQAILANQ
jgi:hypothetical protein